MFKSVMVRQSSELKESIDGEIVIDMWFQIWGAKDEKAQRLVSFYPGNVQEGLAVALLFTLLQVN